MDLMGDPSRGHRDMAAADWGECGWQVVSRVRDGWHRQGLAQRQPAADLQYAPHDVAVLHERKLVAAGGKLRHPGEHGEECVMMPWRNRDEEFLPYRRWGCEGEGGVPRRRCRAAFGEGKSSGRAVRL